MRQASREVFHATAQGKRSEMAWLKKEAARRRLVVIEGTA
jgi:hypothetical protein